MQYINPGQSSVAQILCCQVGVEISFAHSSAQTTRSILMILVSSESLESKLKIMYISSFEILHRKKDNRKLTPKSAAFQSSQIRPTHV